MNKNIALVIGQLSLGGSEKQLFLLSKGLQKSNYNVLVIVLSSIVEPYGRMLKEMGVEVIYIKKRLPYIDFFRIFHLRKKIKDNKINIVYSFSLTANYYSFFSVLFEQNIIFISGSRNIETDRGRFLKIIDDIIIRNSKALITNSQSNLVYIKGISKKPESIKGFVINNGIDISTKKNIKKINVEQNITIGTIALFKKQKNYPLFIEFCNSIASKYEKITFISIGHGPEFEKMVRYAKENNLDGKLKFVGNTIDAEKIMEKNFDIFILTSYKEGLPNVLMEAMSFGIPVVSTNVGGVKELIDHKKTGFLVPSNDLNGLVKYCSQLIKSSSLRKEIGESGRRFINDQFSSEKMVNEFEEVFNKLI
jgi:glycosyltransferase involved in cell wall biosynthesis